MSRGIKPKRWVSRTALHDFAGRNSYSDSTNLVLVMKLNQGSLASNHLNLEWICSWQRNKKLQINPLHPESGIEIASRIFLESFPPQTIA